MTTKSKKSKDWSLILVLLDVTVLFAGPHWLALLIPAALLVWYGAWPTLGAGRN